MIGKLALIAASAVASVKADWSIVAANVGTTASGIAFVSNTEGYLPVGIKMGTETTATAGALQV